MIIPMHPVRDRWSMAKRRITYWRTRGVVGGRYSRYATFTRRLAETLGKSNTTIGRIYNTVYNVAVSNAS